MSDSTTQHIDTEAIYKQMWLLSRAHPKSTCSIDLSRVTEMESWLEACNLCDRLRVKDLNSLQCETWDCKILRPKYASESCAYLSKCKKSLDLGEKSPACLFAWCTFYIGKHGRSLKFVQY